MKCKHLILKLANKLHNKLFKIDNTLLPHEKNPDIISKIISEKLESNQPLMVSRFGANELSVLINYIGVKNNNKNIIKYIKNQIHPWWWNTNHIEGNLFNVAGFYPPTIENVTKFCELIMADIIEIDILGTWISDEKHIIQNIKNPILVSRGGIDPFWVEEPWTKSLSGKKILVIHPFSETIKKQYLNNRNKLFTNKKILPDFELKTIRAVEGFGGNNKFPNWFDALNYMKQEMDQIEYDICLIGAGAFGLPLAAHSKRKGKKAIHIGGSLQLLFGIIGKRWENETITTTTNYPGLINNYWTRPSKNEIPQNVNKIENGAYW